MSIPEERAKLRPGMGFQSPLEVTLAPECEGWEELYPPHALFAEERRAFDAEPLLVPGRPPLRGALLPV